MENIASGYLTKLRIIAMIPEGGQLDLTNSDLNIYTPNLMNWVYRKLHGDGKNNTVQFLQTFYHELFEFTDEIISATKKDSSEDMKNRRRDLLQTILAKIKESVVGIDNLRITYQQYSKTLLALERIKSDISNAQQTIIDSFRPELAQMKTSPPIHILQAGASNLSQAGASNLSQAGASNLSQASTPDTPILRWLRSPENTPY